MWTIHLFKLNAIWAKYMHFFIHFPCCANPMRPQLLVYLSSNLLYSILIYPG